MCEVQHTALGATVPLLELFAVEIFIPELEIQASEQFPNAHSMCWYRVRPVSILSQEGKNHLVLCAGVKGVWCCSCAIHRAQGNVLQRQNKPSLSNIVILFSHLAE